MGGDLDEGDAAEEGGGDVPREVPDHTPAQGEDARPRGPVRWHPRSMPFLASCREGHPGRRDDPASGGHNDCWLNKLWAFNPLTTS